MDPATNTRTLDRALDDAVARLKKVDDARARQLIDEARAFRHQVASWEHQPPTHSEQDRTIDSIMRLLSEAMAMTRHVELQPEPSPDPPPASATPPQQPAPKHVLGRVKLGDPTKK